MGQALLFLLFKKNFIFVFSALCVVLGIELRALLMLGKSSTTELLKVPLCPFFL
jgi:hypothetical protein